MILVDTGVLYAAADDGDVLHTAATDWLADVTDELIVPTRIAVETAWLLATGSTPSTRPTSCGRSTARK